MEVRHILILEGEALGEKSLVSGFYTPLPLNTSFLTCKMISADPQFDLQLYRDIASDVGASLFNGSLEKGMKVIREAFCGLVPQLGEA